MEDPIRFDVLGTPSTNARGETVATLIANGVFASELEARVAISQSLLNGARMLAARSLSWTGVRSALTALRSWSDVVVYQEGYFPGLPTNYCSAHELNYGGALGCHVCNGFYVP